ARSLPRMRAEAYAAEVAASGGHSHGGGEGDAGSAHGHDEGGGPAQSDAPGNGDGHDEAAAESAPGHHDHDTPAAAAHHPHGSADTRTPVAADPASAPELVVHRSPSCGCCLAWVDQMRAAGFRVEVREVADLEAVKRRLGVPPGAASCHTAEVAGYFVEGHVPAADILRLLAERPEARGLAVPGMPLGSPGMEVPSGITQPYDVLLVAADGSTTTFSRHP
ncbi:MAG TPA: DUF411 domain-containing protein, partial [Xanthomonadaceae bacterium]|nr:DUF411 domain-containing protein [Xanthomonadaceae bacterium]